jgi:hypothetical protein
LLFNNFSSFCDEVGIKYVKNRKLEFWVRISSASLFSKYKLLIRMNKRMVQVQDVSNVAELRNI